MATSHHVRAGRSGRGALVLVAGSGVVVFLLLVANLAIKAFG